MSIGTAFEVTLTVARPSRLGAFLLWMLLNADAISVVVRSSSSSLKWSAVTEGICRDLKMFSQLISASGQVRTVHWFVKISKAGIYFCIISVSRPLISHDLSLGLFVSLVLADVQAINLSSYFFSHRFGYNIFSLLCRNNIKFSFSD